MKTNYLFFTFLILLFTSCQKDPDMGELDVDFVVVTDYDSSADFNTFETYYIPDSILVIGNNPTPTWVTSQGNDVVDEIVGNMTQRGYTRSFDKTNANLGIQVTFIQNTTYIASDPLYPYWWWGYPGPDFWGDWGGWYYPYPIVYSYNVGTLIAEMVNLESSTAGTDSQLQVVWTAAMSGLLSGSNSIDMQLAVNAINQAFIQSSYIQK